MVQPGHQSKTTQDSSNKFKSNGSPQDCQTSSDEESSSQDSEESEEQSGETIDQVDTLKVSKAVTKNRRKERKPDPKKKSDIATKTSGCNDKSCCTIF